MKSIWKMLSSLCIVALLMGIFPTPNVTGAAHLTSMDSNPNNIAFNGTKASASIRPERAIAYQTALMDAKNDIATLANTQTQIRTKKTDLYAVIIQFQATNKHKDFGNILRVLCPDCKVEQKELDQAMADLDYYENLLTEAWEKIYDIFDKILDAQEKLNQLIEALEACKLHPITATICAALLRPLIWAARNLLIKVLPVLLAAAVGVLAGLEINVAWAKGKVLLKARNLANCLNKTKECGGKCYEPEDCLYCCDGKCQSNPCPTPTPTPSTPSPTPTTPTSTPIDTPTPILTDTPIPPTDSSSEGDGNAPPMAPSSESIRISPNGGEFSFGENVTVNIPPGAVSAPVSIVYTPRSAISVAGFVPVEFFTLEAYIYTGGQWRKFTDFKKPVSIQVSYSPEKIIGIDESKLGLYSFNNELNQWIAMSSVVDPAKDTVTASEVNYFTLNATLYALMAPTTGAH